MWPTFSKRPLFFYMYLNINYSFIKAAHHTFFKAYWIIKTGIQPFHRDSRDILTKNKVWKLHTFYNNYSGLVKLWYFVKEVASYVLAKKRRWWVTRYQNKLCWISWLTWRTTENVSKFSRIHVISWATSRLNINVLHGIASWYSYLSMTSLGLMTMFIIFFLIGINYRDSCDGQRDSRDIVRININ